MNRKATALWQGALKDGTGTLQTGSGALKNLPYSYRTRFESEPGTNPEELLGAAHAGCFSMALSAELAGLGANPRRIETTALVTLDQVEDGFAITAVHLDVKAEVGECLPEQFQAAAVRVKESCPVSKLLNAEITLEAALIGTPEPAFTR